MISNGKPKKMTKNQIYCKKCNAKFNSMLDFLYHLCPNESKSPQWGKHGVGRRGMTAEDNISNHKLHQL